MSFLEPLALLFAGLYGVLVLFYLWERWRRRVVVPSLLLWEAVREDTVRARRFRPDLLFILQALLLACLILGLAKPYLTDAGGGPLGGRHIFLLDTTASMQSRDGRGARYEAARAQALTLLRGLGADDEVMLITAGRTATVAVNFTRDRAVLAQALEQATPTDTGGDLALAVAFASGAQQRSDLPTELDVFTDVPASTLPAQLRERATVFQVGESDDNLGIEALQIYQGRFQDYRRARAYVLVQNFAHRERHGFLTVQLGDQIVHRSGFTIPARDSKGFLVRDFPGPGRVVAHLEVDDALSADDTAYGWIRPVTPAQVLVVSPPSPLLEELQDLAAATPGLKWTVITPEQFDAQQARFADVVILHRFVPESAPAANVLYIYPPKENGLFPVVDDATNIEVLDWNARHAALQSLRPLAALPLQRARITTAPPWSDVLLASRTTDREFPLAFAGERDGHRAACITFDLEAERLLSTDNVNFFLFFMNLLGWLTPESRDTIVTNTGDVQWLGTFPTETIRVQDPRGGQHSLPNSQPTLEPLFAGEYRVSSDGTRRTVLANFFDPVESDIGRASKEPPVFHQPVVPAPHAAGAAAVPVGSDYGLWLYGVAAALLIGEWLTARYVAQRDAITGAQG